MNGGGDLRQQEKSTDWTWLSPVGDLAVEPWRNTQADVLFWPAGGLWDALRIPERLGGAVLDWFTGNASVAERLGPVLYDRRCGFHYYLVPPGAWHRSWTPPGLRLLTVESWIAVPASPYDTWAGRWLHLPDRPGLLTDADLLAEAVGAAQQPCSGLPETKSHAA